MAILDSKAERLSPSSRQQRIAGYNTGAEVVLASLRRWLDWPARIIAGYTTTGAEVVIVSRRRWLQRYYWEAWG